jgi:imidazolonepropionase
MTPGLIDCHTHLIFAGDRSREFELRLEGASYEEIARAGGGIAATVAATRDAGADELLGGALARLDRLIAEGVTTVEVKSGYGLNAEVELRLLALARRLGRCREIDVLVTFLGAHAVPPEFAGDPEGYIDLLRRDLLPQIAAGGLVDAVDGFCEGIGFSPGQIRRLFGTARALKLPVKLHADQLSNLHGAELAAEFSALSADHLEHTDEAGVRSMRRSGTVAVLLPGAFYCMRETRCPPVESLREHGVPMAVATDCNPGTSPVTSLLFVMNAAALQFGLTVGECLAGTTREAARALGRLGETGTIEPGKWCDLAIWDVERPAELVQRIGFNPLFARIRRGR